MAEHPNQIRINDLARELEVKSKAIIELLPEVGVTEKKTHSSSIDEAHAVKVREHFRAMADAEAAVERAKRLGRNRIERIDGYPGARSAAAT